MSKIQTPSVNTSTLNSIESSLPSLSLSSSSSRLSSKNKEATLSRNPSFAFIPRNKFRILALDGGGVRSMIQCRLLLRICEIYPQFLS